MAAENKLMRPLRSENLKPRPSTQAVWEPCTPVQPPQEPPVPDPLPEPADESAAVETEAVCAPLTESVFTFAPACSAQPEPTVPVPEPEAVPPAAAEKGEEAFDLDAVIAAVLSQDDEDDEDEDHLSAQDALPTEKMPEPVAVPLYDAPQPKPVRKGWIWLIAAALIVTAAGYAARRFGWLS